MFPFVHLSNERTGVALGKGIMALIGIGGTGGQHGERDECKHDEFLHFLIYPFPAVLFFLIDSKLSTRLYGTTWS